MSKHTSDIFQTPTEKKLAQLSFCQTNAKALQEWVSSISILQLGTSSKSLFSALLEIAELDCDETLRFDLIQVLHPTLENVLTSLEKHFVNQGLITTDRNDQIIELAMLLRSHFAKIYIDIAKRCQQQLNEHKFSIFKLSLKKRLETARMVSIYYALQQLSLLLYQQHMLYSSPVMGQWLAAHQLIECAIENNFYLSNINQVLGTQHDIQNISQAYAQLIILEIFNTHQIRPAEIQGLFLCSFEWAKLIHILPKETTVSRYVVDTSKDHPPLFNTRQASHFQANIFISTQNLMEHIATAQSKNNHNLSRNEKLFLTPALHFHLHTLLSTTAERRHERYEYSAQINICFGLGVAHFYLSKGKNFKETLDIVETNFNVQSESSFVSSTQAALPSAFSNIKALDREAKQIHQAEVLDISVNGYRIKWTGATPVNLKTGEFILVQENAQSQWRGGVIRWIKQSAEKSLELGLEILAQELFPCAVYTRSEKNLYPQPALLVQTTQLDQISISIIVSGVHLFKEKQTIHLRLGQHEIKIYLTKAQLITQSFMRFDYELLNDQEEPIVQNFINKQMNEIRNNDLWEALK
ncbi:GTPase [Acinetobacter sp. NCu2D-2]|uniref:GTPase n=1 Tax=Acinetobacter sp. NCu2D-2 TaxID=1608473 RepID=UPI0007CDC561|nr:GTPase [Acinetobacter sp. NCu2D-2]ANF81513.1 GTPase [Acinetobacter sp. NCu2D-2]